MQLVKIKDSNFVRDIHSMAIQPTDNTERNEYYAKLRMIKLQKEDINDVKKEINNLKDDITDIKNLLHQLISKG